MDMLSIPAVCQILPVHHVIAVKLLPGNPKILRLREIQPVWTSLYRSIQLDARGRLKLTGKALQQKWNSAGVKHPLEHRHLERLRNVVNQWRSVLSTVLPHFCCHHFCCQNHFCCHVFGFLEIQKKGRDKDFNKIFIENWRILSEIFLISIVRDTLVPSFRKNLRSSVPLQICLPVFVS